MRLNDDGAPLLNVFGGKITTYRKLAEDALAKLTPLIGGLSNWTAGVPLPGGDFGGKSYEEIVCDVMSKYPFASETCARRFVRAYGMDSFVILGKAASEADLGVKFGPALSSREIDWLMANEYAQTAEDIVWRRSKMGLHLTPERIAAIDHYMKAA